MARCEVVQVQCDRCKRIELRPSGGPPKEKPDFEALFMGEKVVFQDLDEPCKETMKRLVGEIKEWDRELKQKLGPTVNPNQAPPLQVAPNYSPPNPHSAAGAGRR
jgi:hypothetical protein